MRNLLLAAAGLTVCAALAEAQSLAEAARRAEEARKAAGVPFAKDAYAQFQSRGFEILGMDYERSATADQVRAYLNQNGITWTFARPDSVRSLIDDRFQVNSFPTMYLLDPDGRVMPIRESQLRGKALAATLDRILPR